MCKITWVAGGSFAISQFVASNLIDYSLTDVLASMGSLICTLGFLMIWKPAPDPEFVIARLPADALPGRPCAAVRAGEGRSLWRAPLQCAPPRLVLRCVCV